MNKILEILNKYRIHIVVALILLLFIPMIMIAVNKFRQDYDVEKISKAKYFAVLSNHQIGVIDAKGNTVIEPGYYNVCIPNPTKAIFVCYYDYNEQTGKCKTKVINEQGTELFTKYNQIDVIDLNGFETTNPYEKNLLKYEDKGKYGLINLEGEKVLDAKYEEITGLSCKEGELLVKENDKYGVINNKGTELIKPKYDYIAGDEYYISGEKHQISGYIVGEKTEDGYRYGYLNGKRKMMLDVVYNEITRIGGVQGENTDKDIFIIARKNGRCGLMKNKKVVIDFKYQDINYSGVGNLLIVNRNTKSGIFTAKGKKVLDTIYDEITVRDNDIFAVKDKNEIYFNLSGKEISKDSIKEITESEEEQEKEEPKKNITGLTPTQKDGKWGFVNTEGKTVVDYQYEDATEMNAYGYAGIKKNGKWGAIDAKGTVVQEPKYNLDGIEDISFIGKYYKVVYDYRETYYTDNITAQEEE